MYWHDVSGPLAPRNVLRMPEYSYPRYLHAKRSVDDRALNQQVMDAALGGFRDKRDVRVAELGGGVGTMIDRLVEREVFAEATYTVVDTDADFLREVVEHAPAWRKGRTRRDATERACSVSVDVVEARMEAWLQDTTERYDLIVAHAVLDLIDIPRMLPTLLSRLAPGGVFWTTINFDGDSIFMPRQDDDRALMQAYHDSMDARGGSSTTGRELFGRVAEAGGAVLAAGSSDWVVFPQPGGGYPEDEAYFLHHIVHTVEEELGNHPQLGDATRRWGPQRHAQVERGELVYVAHQLDFAAQRAE